MSKEKKAIKEMAKVIDEFTEPLSARDIHKAEFSEQFAEALYNAGYRKQSEGEWISELRDRCDWRGKKQQYYQPNSCSVCHEAVVERTPFCPNCGAKMKGESNEQRKID